MYRGSKALEGKGKRGSKRAKRWVVGDHPPMTPLEFFIYVCTILFVMVFAVMQGVFLYKLHLYEASMDEPTKPDENATRALMAGLSSSSSAAVATLSNRQRIEFMANATARAFAKWPPLDAIVDEKEGKVIGNPQFLLDFGILGFEKSGEWEN